jgi:hypothetical protein
MDRVFEMGSTVKRLGGPYTDAEKVKLKQIFHILDNEEDTEENVEQLRRVLSDFNLSFSGNDIEVMYFWFHEDGGIRTDFTNIFILDKYDNKLNFIYCLLDHEIEKFRNTNTFKRLLYRLNTNTKMHIFTYLFENGIHPDTSYARTNGQLNPTLLLIELDDDDDNIDFLKLLLEYGADPNNRNSDQTPMQYLFEMYSEEPDRFAHALRLFLEYGGDYTGHEDDNPVVQQYLAYTNELYVQSQTHFSESGLAGIISEYGGGRRRKMNFTKEGDCVIC